MAPSCEIGVGQKRGSGWVLGFAEGEWWVVRRWGFYENICTDWGWGFKAANWPWSSARRCERDAQLMSPVIRCRPNGWGSGNRMMGSGWWVVLGGWGYAPVGGGKRKKKESAWACACLMNCNQWPVPVDKKPERRPTVRATWCWPQMHTLEKSGTLKKT